jgi:hypothetical protein
MHDVASGLAYMHRREPQVIHQDIKPDNVLVDDDGRYLITDFGISVKVRSTLHKDVTNAMSMTFAYAAPERFSRKKKPTPSSDIWSLGATIYELLDGDAPFSDIGGMMQQKGAEIPEVEGAFSKELCNLVERCLALEPENRPSAEDIVTVARQHVGGLSQTVVESRPIKEVHTPTKRTTAGKKTNAAAKPEKTEKPERTSKSTVTKAGKKIEKVSQPTMMKDIEPAARSTMMKDIEPAARSTMMKNIKPAARSTMMERKEAESTESGEGKVGSPVLTGMRKNLLYVLLATLVAVIIGLLFFNNGKSEAGETDLTGHEPEHEPELVIEEEDPSTVSEDPFIIAPVTEPEPVQPPPVETDNTPAVPEQKAKSADAFLRDGNKAYNDGNYPEAIANYEVYLGMMNNPSIDERLKAARECVAIRRRADEFFLLKRYDEAGREYRLILEKNYGDKYARQQLDICSKQTSE